ncbi:hypothetical protein QWJ34_02125 [Saccharibacillus sp. CPCC 101409]|uniref:hypothetical protein n=1 Tax=Saccharibacillus sp. CPCC 101409 TaxID=3058041 RepID=UPI0026740FD4|nr:hypothetical protein [Saccharibacillus sp. CPCC 101409]MDO3408559.1 hypothetical protein [Saccharibacillus sp. CPCC 101409]
MDDSEMPEPEEREGYYWIRMILLEGEAASKIYYTYEPIQPQPPSEIDLLREKVETLEAADLDNKEMIYGLAALLMGE